MHNRWMLTDHAVLRYQQRLQRPLTFKQCRRELLHMLPLAEHRQDPPEWIRSTGRQADGYLMLADVALVLQGRHIVTCLTRGTLPPAVRRYRNEKRSVRRWKKRRGSDTLSTDGRDLRRQTSVG